MKLCSSETHQNKNEQNDTNQNYILWYAECYTAQAVLKGLNGIRQCVIRLNVVAMLAQSGNNTLHKPKKISPWGWNWKLGKLFLNFLKAPRHSE